MNLNLKRTVTGALLSGVAAVATLGLASLGPGVGTAQAEVRCDPVCHGTWCPGDPVWAQVRDLMNTWDTNVCHEFHQVFGATYAEGPLPPGTFVCPPISFMCP